MSLCQWQCLFDICPSTSPLGWQCSHDSHHQIRHWWVAFLSYDWIHLLPEPPPFLVPSSRLWPFCGGNTPKQHSFNEMRHQWCFIINQVDVCYLVNVFISLNEVYTHFPQRSVLGVPINWMAMHSILGIASIHLLVVLEDTREWVQFLLIACKSRWLDRELLLVLRFFSAKHGDVHQNHNVIMHISCSHWNQHFYIYRKQISFTWSQQSES